MSIVACEVPSCGYVTSAPDASYADVLYALHMVIAHNVPLTAFDDDAPADHPGIAEAESRRDNPSNYDEPPGFNAVWESEATRHEPKDTP